MKKFLVAFLVTFTIFSSYSGYTQRYRNKEISLISFNITIYPETRQFLEKLEGNFTPYKNPKADKIVGAIKEKTWVFLIDKLQSDIGMFILPLNTFGNNFNYDIFGFPDGSTSRAQKNGESKFYMKIEMLIGADINQKYSTNFRDSTNKPIVLKEGQILPKVTINITTYPDNGILPIGKYTGIAVAPQPFDLTPYVLDGLVNVKNSEELTTLMGVINEAIAEISINILAE